MVNLVAQRYYDMMSSTFDRMEENLANDKAESEALHEYREHYKQFMKEMRRKQNEIKDSPIYKTLCFIQGSLHLL